MGLTDLVVNTGVVQDTLGSGSFTSINVGHYTNISSLLKRNVSWHSVLLKIITEMAPRRSLRTSAQNLFLFVYSRTNDSHITQIG